MGVYILPTREQALANYYNAERRAGVCEQQQAKVSTEMERINV